MTKKLFDLSGTGRLEKQVRRFTFIISDRPNKTHIVQVVAKNKLLALALLGDYRKKIGLRPAYWIRSLRFSDA